MTDTINVTEGPPPSLSPSEKWPEYTDSKFSEKHLDAKARKNRTSTIWLTAANLTKMYVGIAFISVPKSVALAGIYGSAIGFVYIILMNTFCIYILLQARNRFKREPIVDICDLAERLYGSWTRPFLAVLLISTNGTFLMAYIMFFGTQTDQLVCKTFKANDCGYARFYSAGILLLLFPILLVRRLRGIGFFSIFILIFTFISIGIIIYLSIVILQMTPQEANDTYGLDITDEDRDYNYIDPLMIPVFCATMMTLFEGNQQILNLYSEVDKPQQFFTTALTCIVLLTFLVAMTIGYLGYLAFGNGVKSVILYSLPNNDPAAITAKICYVLTIVGSFVILIQPIYYILESSNWYKALGGTDEDDSTPPPPPAAKKPEEQPTPEEPPMNEGGEEGKEQEVDSNQTEEDKFSCCQWFMFIGIRALVVVVFFGISCIIPNLHILLTFGGAILGTIVNILLPVLFYNKAYQFTPRNRRLETGKKDLPEDEQPLMDNAQNEGEDGESDPRQCTKITSWIVLAFGIIIAIVGLIYIIMELKDGAKADSA